MPESSRSIDSGENRLGVPPPIKTEITLRPQIDGSANSRSARSASTYAPSGMSSRASCELKSQYGHFFRHHGMCTYSDSGGSALNFGRVSVEAENATTVAGLSVFMFTKLIQSRDQRSQRLAAMRHGILQFQRHLRAAHPALRVAKMRVVAKAASATRLIGNCPPPRSFGNQRLRIVGAAHQYQHAVVMRAPICDAGEGGNQSGIVARVGFRIAGVTRALHARRAGERVDADARIVRQRRQFRKRARVACLGKRIFDEGDVRLVGIRDDKVALRHDRNAKRSKQAAEFAELARIARRENQPSDHVLSAAFCAAISLRIPRSPSATSASI